MLVREMRIGLDGDGGVVDYGEILERSGEEIESRLVCRRVSKGVRGACEWLQAPGGNLALM
jgi:hypothetical protein